LCRAPGTCRYRAAAVLATARLCAGGTISSACPATTVIGTTSRRSPGRALARRPPGGVKLVAVGPALLAWGEADVGVVQPVGRRTLLRAFGVAVPGVVVAACTVRGLPWLNPLGWGLLGSARLTARPPAAGSVSAAVPPPGLHTLDLGPGPEVLVHVPTPASGDAEFLRLVLTLHGAGGTARGGLAPLLPFADAHRLLLVSPSSHDPTWDVLTQGRWGADVERINHALAQIFATYRVDSTRLAISGFSDGASYALSVGLANADLFTHIIAFSPGFLVPTPRVGTPQVYISHGRADTVLPIDQTTRRIVAQLRAANIPIELHEFDGPHVVPADIAADAAGWLTRP
jgi:phospholipase/carboxylesterase